MCVPCHLFFWMAASLTLIKSLIGPELFCMASFLTRWFHGLPGILALASHPSLLARSVFFWRRIHRRPVLSPFGPWLFVSKW